DLVLARRAVGGVRQVAPVAHLPEAIGLEAVDRAEWLPDPHDVGLPALDKTAAPHAREDLRDASQVEDLVPVTRQVERAAPAEARADDVHAGDRQLDAVVLHGADVLKLIGEPR